MKLNELNQEEKSTVQGGSILGGLPIIGGSGSSDDSHSGSSSSSGHDGNSQSGQDGSNNEGSSGLPIVGDLLGDSLL